jgi:uncharacterized delta-60 repeat protein
MHLTRALPVLAASLAIASAAPAQGATLASETTWGGPAGEVAEGSAIAADGSTYLAGFTNSFNPSSENEIFLVKVASDGSLTWQRTWEGPIQFASDQANDVAVAPDGSVYVTGSTQGIRGDVVLLKFSPDGSLLWQQRWDSGSTESGEAVAVGADGSVYVAGGTTAGDGNILVLKFSSDGSVVWQKTWGPAGGFNGVAVGPDGNVYVVGNAARADSSGSDVVLLKLDPAGALLMQKSYSASEIADARGGVAVATDGSIHVAGAIQEVDRDVVVDAMLVKFAPDGSLVWDRSWGGRSGDVSGAVAAKPDGTVLWAGDTNSFGAGSDDAFLLQMSLDGKAMDASTWGGTGIDHATGVEVAADGTNLLGGTTETPVHVFDRGPRKTSRLRGTVGTPDNALQDAAGAAVDAGGTAEASTGTSPGAGGFDAALVRIGPDE